MSHVKSGSGWVVATKARRGQTTAMQKAEEEAAARRKAEEEAAARRKAEEEAAARRKAEQAVVKMIVVFGFYSNARCTVTHRIHTTMTSSEMQKYINSDSLHYIALKTKHTLMSLAKNVLGLDSRKSSKFFEEIYQGGLFVFVYDLCGQLVRELRILPPIKFIVGDLIEEDDEKRMTMIRKAAIDYLTSKNTFQMVFGTLEPEPKDS
jgi:hypothetical protein